MVVLGFNEPIEVYAIKDRDTKALERAASGGAFSVLARPFVDAGGVVFGAKMGDNGTVQHVAARSRDELALLQGSAYVQSDTTKVYEVVEVSVKSGLPTLFVGTPCQCAAVESYLILKHAIESLDEQDNLFLCDVICHGVPNGTLFRAHQKWLARKVNADDGIHSFKFRSKKNGWGLYYYYYYYRRGKKYEICEPGNYDPYYAAFLRGETYRESCYKCPYARRERVTDYTIGDYWGVESAHPDFPAKGGVSVLLINTERGVANFEAKSKKACLCVVSDFEKASRENHNLCKPTIRPSSRDNLLLAYSKRCLESNLDTLFDVDLRIKRGIKGTVNKLLPAAVVLKIKRIVRAIKSKK